MSKSFAIWQIKRATSKKREPVGFILGEWISAHCYVIHFTKALHSIKGLYPYLYQDVAQSFKREEESWINMKQDLGLPPLRQTKHSYLPF